MNRRRGFTLIELLVVMALLAILMAMGVGTYTASLKKGRDSTRKNNLRSITTALEMYYNDKGAYPKDSGAGTGGTLPGCYAADSSTGTCGLDYTSGISYPLFKDSAAGGATYLTKFPVDPVSSQKYYYVSADGKQYQIYAHLENDQDPQIDAAIVAKNYNCAPATAPIAVCNFGLSSANITP